MFDSNTKIEVGDVVEIQGIVGTIDGANKSWWFIGGTQKVTIRDVHFDVDDERVFYAKNRSDGKTWAFTIQNVIKNHTNN